MMNNLVKFSTGLFLSLALIFPAQAMVFDFENAPLGSIQFATIEDGGFRMTPIYNHYDIYSPESDFSSIVDEHGSSVMRMDLFYDNDFDLPALPRDPENAGDDFGLSGMVKFDAYGSLFDLISIQVIDGGGLTVFSPTDDSVLLDGDGTVHFTGDEWKNISWFDLYMDNTIPPYYYNSDILIDNIEMRKIPEPFIPALLLTGLLLLGMNQTRGSRQS